MDLRPFDPGLAERVATWTTGPDEVNAWSSRFDDNVPPDVIAGWSAADDVEAYVGVVGSEAIAYGELWLDDDEGEVELARILLDPARRGQGLGKAFTLALVDQARQQHPELPDVILRFRPDNIAARHTYASAGFVELDADETATWNEGQPTAYVWMRLP
jgi:[ribosomal protein S18]-alanine N-acetyltransferase